MTMTSARLQRRVCAPHVAFALLCCSRKARNALRDWNSVPVLLEGKDRGLHDVRGDPLPCVTTVSTTSNLGLPRSVTNLGPSTSARVLEDLLRRRIPQRRCACFPEQSLRFPGRCKAPPRPL